MKMQKHKVQEVLDVRIFTLYKLTPLNILHDGSHVQLEFGYAADRPVSSKNGATLKKFHKKIGSTYHEVVPVDLPEIPDTDLEFDRVELVRKLWRAEVVLCTPETITSDDNTELYAIDWQVLVVDEAHRLKNVNSKLSQALSNKSFNFDFKVALTGTPLQNNLGELWSLLHFIDPLAFPTKSVPGMNIKKQYTESSFNDTFGGLSDGDRLKHLHKVIGSYILRRLKYDVEKTVPPKSETIISCAMPSLQKLHYMAIYEKNLKYLAVESKTKVRGPNLNNIAMELRKCCNHPFLIYGAEDKMRENMIESMKGKNGGVVDEKKLLIDSCGKFKLLDKLLPKLQEEDHRVLIFSQFVIMLDILEDYLNLHKYDYCRIDGSVTGRRRQAEIDRFQGHTISSTESKSSSDSPFVMLLSTRAGGVGINLTAADTVIIYDSDWNPQNDIQAQARCHRIGQTKPVSIYRLITRKTYEEKMFHNASLKMGLDEVVLHKMNKGSTSSAKDKEMTPDEIERLLKVGAMDVFNEYNDDKEDVNMSIEEILKNSKTVIHDPEKQSEKAGGEFSKVSFDNEDDNETRVAINDEDFWEKTLGREKFEKLTATKEQPKKRIKITKNYTEDYYGLGDEEFSSPDDGESSRKKRAKRFKGLGREGYDFSGDKSDWSDEEWDQDNDDDASNVALPKPQVWSTHIPMAVFQKVFRAAMNYGYGCWKQIRKSNDLVQKYCESDVKYALDCMVLVYLTETLNTESLKRQEKLKSEANDSAPAKSYEDIRKDVFRDTWRAYKFWVMDILVDIQKFGRTEVGKARKKKFLKQKDAWTVAHDELHNKAVDFFWKSLWPQLSSRGWKNEGFVGFKGVPPKSKSQMNVYYDSIGSILGPAKHLHGELSHIIDQISSLDADSKKQEQEASKGDRKDTAHVEDSEAALLTKADAAYPIFNEIFEWYIPSAMRTDKKFRLSVADNLRYLSRVHHIEALKIPLQDKSLGAEGDVLVPHLKNKSPDAELWRREHDIVLIKAIQKHGWISDKNFLVISKDPELQWPTPYGPGCSGEGGSDQVSTTTDDPLLIRSELCARASMICNKAYDKDGISTDLLSASLKRTFNLNQVAVDGQGGGLKWVPGDAEVGKEHRACRSSGLMGGKRSELPEKSLLNARAVALAKEISYTAESGYSETLRFYKQKAAFASDPAFQLLVTVVEAATGGLPSAMNFVKMVDIAKAEFDTLLSSAGNSTRQTMLTFSKNFEEARIITDTLSVDNMNKLRAVVGLEEIDAFEFEERILLSKEESKRSELIKLEKEKAKSETAAYNALVKSKKVKNAAVFESQTSGLNLTRAEVTILHQILDMGIPVSSSSDISDDPFDWTWQKLSERMKAAAQDLVSKATALHQERQREWQTIYREIEAANANGQWAVKGRILSARNDRCNKSRDEAKEALDEAKFDYDEVMRFCADSEAPEGVMDTLGIVTDTLGHGKHYGFAKNVIELVEAIRNTSGVAFGVKGPTSKTKSDNGLGSMVLYHGVSMIQHWGEELGLNRPDGGELCQAKTSFRSSAASTENLSARVTPQSARAIFAQICQQSRLRAIYLKIGVAGVASKVKKVNSNVIRSGDSWPEMPCWWNAQCDLGLLTGLVEKGWICFDDIFEDERYRLDAAYSKYVKEPEAPIYMARKDKAGWSIHHDGKRLRRCVCQTRVNQLLREYSSMEDDVEDGSSKKKKNSKSKHNRSGEKKKRKDTTALDNGKKRQK